MKIKDGFILRTVAGNSIVLAVGERSRSFNKMIKLNETGSFLFSLLQKETDERSLLSALCEKYEIDEETAKADISAFLSSLREADVLEL